MLDLHWCGSDYDTGHWVGVVSLQDSLQVTTHHGPRGRHLTSDIRVATCHATQPNNMNLINSENIHLIMSARRITARDVTPAGLVTTLRRLHPAPNIDIHWPGRPGPQLPSPQMPKVRNLTTATPKVRDMFIINIQVILLEL